METKFALALCVLTLVSANSNDEVCECAKNEAIKLRKETTCPLFCTKIFFPVCGFNPCENSPETQYETFGNRCELDGTVCEGPGNLYYFLFNGTCTEGPY